MNWKYVYVIHVNTEVFPPSSCFKVHEAIFRDAGDDSLIKYFEAYGPQEKSTNIQHMSDLVDCPLPIAVEYQDGCTVWLHEGSRKYHNKKEKRNGK